MLFTKNASLALLRCGACHGAGYRGFRRCSSCHGMTVARIARGVLLYWGEPLTRYHVTVRHVRRWKKMFELTGSVVFGVGFLALYLYVLSSRPILNNVFTLHYWMTSADSARMLFWFSVVSFSFFVYRLIADQKPQTLVEHAGYEGAKEKTPEESSATLGSWQEVRRMPHRKRLDIADTFTPETRAVLERAYILAYQSGHGEVTPFHVFSALLSAQKIGMVFIRLGIHPDNVQARLKQAFQSSALESREPGLSADVQQIMFHAYESAYHAKQEYVHITELLLATVQQSDAIQELLYDLDIDKNKLTNVVAWLRIRERLHTQFRRLQRAAAHRSKYGLDRAMTAVATPYLNNFSQDLTMAAKYGYMPPCVARDKEIEEIFRIIEGGRHSVLLVGEHGVGKMSIIEGITQKMIADDTPQRLRDKRLVQLSTSALLAGATMSGAQERLMSMMREVGKAGNIILFIKNIHDLMTIENTNGQEGLDVSETLSEFLGPGKFLTLATTTLDAYNKHILNSELGTVFSRVDINEMDENQAIQVLESKVGSIEYKHNVFFSYAALEQSVKLAGRFLQDQRLPESAISIMTEAASYTRNHKGEQQLVAADDVATIIHEKTGIPVTTISEDESSKLLRLEEEMHKRVIGQHQAVLLVANALRRARAEIRSQKKPIANFLFLGPTGVGKTELAKTIADVYFGGEDRMIRVDMSEYQDKSGIYRLIGQPGQQGSGILTEAVRQHPFSLVLFDEMEKADPDVLNLFLQVFDDGRLTDSVGRLIDFTNTIIIATSNAGTQYVADQLGKGVELEEIRQSLIRGELKKYYRPEFLNRFDGIVLFRALDREEIKQVAGLMLKRVEKDLEKRGVFLRVDAAALESLADVGFDPEFGARPMRRATQDTVENNLAELVLGGKLKRRDTVVIGEGGKIKVEGAK